MRELYDLDVLEWSERQARLLRQHAAGEAGNEVPDWTSIIEEVESVGRGQADAVESLLTLAFLHDLKAAAWPLSRDVPHWQGEARLFRRQARRKLTASMRAEIDMAALYDDAVAGLPETMDGQLPLPVPQECPVTLDELLQA
jgi:hypothetical protein